MKSLSRRLIVLVPAVFAWTFAASSQPFFTNAASEAGIEPATYVSLTNHGLGVNWIDYDKDAWPDLFLVDGYGGRPRLYRNEGGGRFSNRDHLLPAGLPDVEMMGSVFADYDTDGDSDIYVFTDNERGSIGPVAGPPNLLLKNLWVENGRRELPGRPLFVEVAAEAGVDDLLDAPLADGPAYRSSTGAWMDVDRDGWVDLYVCHWVRPPDGEPTSRDRLFRNLGDGTFEDVTDASGIAAGTAATGYRPCLALVGADLNKDLWPDAYVVNIRGAYQQDVLLENRGDGTFADRTPLSPGFGDDTAAGMGVAVGDVDLDGDWDLYVSDLYDAGDSGDTPLGNAFYRHTGEGLVYNDNEAAEAGVVSDNSWGVNFLDADHDGYEDLFVVTMGPRRDELYVNEGGERFTKMTVEAGFSTALGSGRGSALADFDRDGDLDIAVVGKNAPLELYRNDTPRTGHWLQVALTATTSNRDAIGTVVVIEAGGKTMMRQVLGGASGHGQDALTVHFGLGEATVVDSLRVFWPSGAIGRFENLRADRFVTVIEPGILATPRIRGASVSPVGGLISTPP